jgi:hypothetical protein
MYLNNLESPAAYKLLGYLEALSDFIRTGEVKWYFDVRLFETDAPGDDLKAVIKEAYPAAKVETAELVDASILDLIETFQHELGQFLPEHERLRIITPISSMTGMFWEYLREAIDHDESRVFEYVNPESDELLHGIAGHFAVIILNEKLRRCLILSGTTSD